MNCLSNNWNAAQCTLMDCSGTCFGNNTAITYYLDADKIFYKSLNIKKIQTNLDEIINDLRFFDSKKILLHSDEISIKDMLVLDNNLYYSYVKEVYENCFNTSIFGVSSGSSKSLLPASESGTHSTSKTQTSLLTVLNIKLLFTI